MPSEHVPRGVKRRAEQDEEQAEAKQADRDEPCLPPFLWRCLAALAAPDAAAARDTKDLEWSRFVVLNLVGRLGARRAATAEHEAHDEASATGEVVADREAVRDAPAGERG